jgi:hypothetical protein
LRFSQRINGINKGAGKGIWAKEEKEIKVGKEQRN